MGFCMAAFVDVTAAIPKRKVINAAFLPTDLLD
jgi:hypothetical protein